MSTATVTTAHERIERLISDFDSFQSLAERAIAYARPSSGFCDKGRGLVRKIQMGLGDMRRDLDWLEYELRGGSPYD